jgi:PHD/YefM family antitoxin component YafN of YafNO toxin-antitoxin module
MHPSKLQNNRVPDELSSLLGLRTERVGKTWTRQNFLPLVDDLKKHPRAIEITDRDKPEAVLLNYDHYVSLILKLSTLTAPLQKKRFSLAGSVTILGDLESGSKAIAEDFEKAIERSAKNI